MKLILTNKKIDDFDGCEVFYWSDYYDGDGISIPKWIDDNSDSLIKLYLAFIHDIGEAKYKDRTLIQEMVIDKRFSLWWMSLLVEKSVWKSRHIDDAFKCLAFQELIKKNKPEEIVDCLDDVVVSNSIKKWCTVHSVLYKRRNVKTNLLRIKNRILNTYSSFPHIIQALVYLLYYVFKRVNFKSAPIQFIKDGKLFVSYFPNIDMGKAKRGVFYSNYWGKLHDVFEEENIKVNWLLLFVSSKQVTEYKDALKIQGRFNDVYRGRQSFVFLDEFISIKVILKVIGYWLRLVFKLLLVSNINKYKNIQKNDLLYDVLLHDIKSSVYGKTAVENCIFYALFDECVSYMPEISQCFYLSENQAWERAFISIWKNSKKSSIASIQHTAIADFDLRHFSDPRLYGDDDIYSIPVPDLMAVNGKDAYSKLSLSGYPKELLVKLEALRYLYLSEIDKNSRQIKSNENNLLVVTDYLHSESEFQLRLLSGALNSSLVQKYNQIIVKPHPFCDVKDILVKLNIDEKVVISDIPVSELLRNCSMAYFSNYTSAVLEAVYMRIPCVVALSGNSFNMSPVRRMENIKFVYSADLLVEALDNVAINEAYDGFFELDMGLNAWKKILNNSGNETKCVVKYN